MREGLLAASYDMSSDIVSTSEPPRDHISGMLSL